MERILKEKKFKKTLREAKDDMWLQGRQRSTSSRWHDQHPRGLDAGPPRGKRPRSLFLFVHILCLAHPLLYVFPHEV